MKNKNKILIYSFVHFKNIYSLSIKKMFIEFLKTEIQSIQIEIN